MPNTGAQRIGVLRPPLETLQQRMSRLAHQTAKANWDDDEGEAISAALWDRAPRVIALTSKYGEPSVAPAGDGSIHFNWRKGDGRMFVIELSNSGLRWSSIDRNGKTDEGRDTEPRQVVDHLARILAD